MGLACFPRLRSFAALLVIAALLTACGGGGTFTGVPGGPSADEGTPPPSDTTPPPAAPTPATTPTPTPPTPTPPTPPAPPEPPAPPAPPPPGPADTTAPVLAFATTSPIGLTASITVTADEALATGTSTYAISVVGQDDSFAVPGTLAMAADRRSFTWTPVDAMPYVTQWIVTATAQDASGNRSTIAQQFETVQTTPEASWWPPHTVLPQGLRAIGPLQLPWDCTSWTTVCWHSRVGGYVQFVASSAVVDGRHVAFAYYINTDGRYAVLPVHRDDGSPLTGDINTGVATEIDWIMGTAQGVNVHERVADTCTAYSYSAGAWTTAAVACPADNTTPTLAFAASPIGINGPITVSADEPLQHARVTVMRGDIIQVLGSVTLAADGRSFSWTPLQPMSYFDELEVFSSAWDQAGNRSAAISRTYHTVDSPAVAPWWPPAQVTANGVKVIGANALPAGCAGWPANCWKDAVRNGTVKFFQAGGSILSEGRPVVHAFYRRISPADGITPEWCVMPEWLDDGWKPPAGIIFAMTSMASCVSHQVDWVMGTFDGYMLPDAGAATCTRYTLLGASLTSGPAACPP
jgi:hypothetical protein